MQLILISGLSGSGKSIALNVLEDAAYFCVDNLPLPLLPHLVDQLYGEGHDRVAVAMDMRGGAGVAAYLPRQLQELRDSGHVDLRFIFLDARDEVLIQRFSETRRRHPMAGEDTTLAEAIAREREALEPLSSLGHHIDTSNLRPNALRTFVKDFVGVNDSEGLTLMFESFGFKHGLPMDADLVFDVRCLPNPHFVDKLRKLTGRDPAVVRYMRKHSATHEFIDRLTSFLKFALPHYVAGGKSYLTVAIGCTGGQHRSVMIAEALKETLGDVQGVRVRVKHRDS